VLYQQYIDSTVLQLRRFELIANFMFRFLRGARMTLRCMHLVLSQLLRSEEGKQQALLAAAGQQTAHAVAQQQQAHCSL
jgi:hypothetical protein